VNCQIIIFPLVVFFNIDKIISIFFIKNKKMLEHISGQITAIEKNEITVTVGSIGMCIAVPHAERYTVSSTIKLYTYLHWHQENGPTLFGFDTLIEKKLFLLLLSCAGIGPKIALAAVGTFGTHQLATAIAQQNIQVIAQVPGIGTKKAESLAVLLKSKARDFLEAHNLVDAQNNDWFEVQQALVSLGYSTQEITHATTSLHNKQLHLLSFDQQLRHALHILSKEVAN
jgi:Holliday junction DNA helicase RuvA